MTSAAAAKALAAAADAAAKTAAQAKLDEVTGARRLARRRGALDFAGGTVVHINAGIAGLVGALIIGKRIGYGKDLMAPHSLTMTMIGASLLWVGWFGFNAGSNLEANGGAALALSTPWSRPRRRRCPGCSPNGSSRAIPRCSAICSGAVAGLVAVTPASGFAGPIGAIVLGLVVSPVCLFFVTAVKNALGYDDALDVFGVHCIGGIIGALGTGILVNPALGGVGITDYTNITGNNRRHLRFRHPDDRAGQGGRHRRCSGRASVRRSSTRSSMSSSACVPPSKRNAKVSTSPITASAPTICKFSRGAISEVAPRTTVWAHTRQCPDR